MKIHWWVDSAGRYTCHENIKGLSATESLLGWLSKIENKWYYWVIKDDIMKGPFENMGEARKTLEKHVGGTPMNDWE